MIPVYEMAWIKYNANKNDARKGDCSIRALSLAYNLPYKTVEKELRSYAYGEQGWLHYNSDKTIKHFIEEHGCEQPFKQSTKCTVAEFCEDHPVGTYLVYTGDNGGNAERGGDYEDISSNHILCIIDGDNYDSWNSEQQYVKEFCIVDSNASDLANNMSSRYSSEEINEKVYTTLSNAVETYITANNGKAFELIGWDNKIYNTGKRYQSYWYNTSFFWMVVKDAYTVVIGYFLSTKAQNFPKGFQKKFDIKLHDNTFALKFSPKITNEEIDSIIAKDIPTTIKKLANGLKKEQELYNKLTSEDVFADYPNLDLNETLRYSDMSKDKLYDLLRNCNQWVKDHVQEVSRDWSNVYRVVCIPDDADKRKGKSTGRSTVDGVTKEHYARVYLQGKNAKQINACCDLYLSDLSKYDSAETYYDYSSDVL